MSDNHGSRVSIPSRTELLRRSHEWASKLLDGPIAWFPIRHHSPACAWHLQQWIEHYRPASVIIEGPSSFNRWLDLLNDDKCQPPIAILTADSQTSDNTEPLSAFYPFCRYSPEWVAVRTGTVVGARVQFADLEAGEKRRHAAPGSASQKAEPDHSPTGVLLSDDSTLRHSKFIRELSRRMGCRDFDELWDHLFETVEYPGTKEFVGTLATYCDLTRSTLSIGRLESDLTLAREAEMLNAVQTEFERLKRPTRQSAIVVVAGGLHTVALCSESASEKQRSRQSGQRAESRSWLIRYSYDQLDALSGYRSGMPSPAFYDAMFQRRQNPSLSSHRPAFADLIAQIARRTRGRPIAHEASVTDVIAAVDMMEQLAALRGHSTPSRTDLMDAVVACMQKDSLAGHHELRSIMDAVLAGDRVGAVPMAAGQPPIVEDFRLRTEAARLPCGVLEAKSVSLELYRRPEHRTTSFLFHQLRVLNVPYATFVDGPDFINGYHLNRLREEWTVAWSLNTEAELIRCSSWGESIAAATETGLLRRLNELELSANARSAAASVHLLIQACRCGLQRIAGRIAQLVEVAIAEDGSFASVAGSLGQLHLLSTAREPLEATRLTQLPDLIRLSYRRACALVDSLRQIPDDQLDASLEGLLTIRETLAQTQVADGTLGEETSRDVPDPDDSLFSTALSDLLQRADHVRAEIAGAISGLLYTAGLMNEAEVCRIVHRYLNAAVEDISLPCGVVRGLMVTGRECFWRMEQLLQSIDQLLADWDEDRFHNAVPGLRLAFSALAPKEIDAVAQKVANLHSMDSIGPLANPAITENDLAFGLRVSQLMNQSLRRDGLR